MRPHAVTPAALLILALAVLTLGCESATGDDIGPSIGGLLDETLTPAATGGMATARSTARPPAGDAEGQLRVLWMLRDQGGAGVAVVRFATNVETVAVLSVLTAIGQPPVVEPQGAPVFAIQHTISTPLGSTPGGQPTFLNLEVTDRQGARATAILEYGDVIAGSQYWARAEGSRPAFAWTAPFKGNATWSNILGSTPPPGPSSVQVFARKAGCTTAEQCQGTLIATFTDDTRTEDPTTPGPSKGERHSIPVELPPTPEQDFQLLYTTPIDSGGTTQVTTHFYQRDIPRSAAAAGRD